MQDVLLIYFEQIVNLLQISNSTQIDGHPSYLWKNQAWIRQIQQKC